MFETSSKKYRYGTRTEKNLKKRFAKYRKQLKQQIARRKALRRKNEKELIEEPTKGFIPYIQSDDKELTLKVKHLMPEQTYEIWLREPHLHESIFNHIRALETKVDTDGGSKTSEEETTESYDDDDGDDDDDEEEEEEEDYGDEEEEKGGGEGEEEEEVEEQGEEGKGKSDTSFGKSNLDYVRALLKFDLAKSGLEVLPYNGIKGGWDHLNTRPSHLNLHNGVLNQLMFFCILRKKWSLALRCYSILIRATGTDLRDIWPIGLEIITKYTEDQLRLEGGKSDYDLRTFDNNREVMDRTDLPDKDEKFISWMRGYFIIPSSDFGPARAYMPPTYVVGTRSSSPVYAQSLIWLLITKLKFKEVNEKLEELLQMKPYEKEGMFYFLQGFSFQLEAAILSKRVNFDSNKVENLLLSANDFYLKAKERNVTYPKKLLKIEMQLISQRLLEEDQLEGEEELLSQPEGINDTTFNEREFAEPPADFDDFDAYQDSGAYESRKRNEDSGSEDFENQESYKADFDEFEDD